MSLSLKQLEELSLTHWPALNTEYLDSWKLRMANGYTKRANSISTIHGISKQQNLNIAACEQRYLAVKQPTIFKITPFSEPKLDETLAALQYRMVEPSYMMSLSLAELSSQEPQLHLPKDAEFNICLLEHISLEWLENYCQASGVSSGYIPTMIDMLAAIPGKLRFAACYVNGELAALALTVAEHDYIGLYDVITVAKFRNLGICSYLLWSLLNEAKGNVSYSYLAVVQANAAALHVYSKLGYTPEYSYWYRMKD